MKVVKTGYEFRPGIAKANKSDVSTGVFTQPEYDLLSGLLCSRVDACNRPATLGDDFQFAPNPNAKYPLTEEFRLRGTYFRPEKRSTEKGDEISIVPETQ
jgi:hypothetical protein